MGAFSDSDEEEGGEAGAALEQGFFGQAVLPEDFKAKGLRMSVGLVDCKPGEVMEFILDRPGEPTRRKVSKNTYTTEPATWKGLAVGCVGSLAGNRLCTFQRRNAHDSPTVANGTSTSKVLQITDLSLNTKLQPE